MRRSSTFMNSALICSSDNIGSRSESDRPPARHTRSQSGHEAGAATRGGREGGSGTYSLATRGESGGGVPEAHLPEGSDPARTCVLCPPAPGTPGTTPQANATATHSCQSRAAVTGLSSFLACPWGVAHTVCTGAEEEQGGSALQATHLVLVLSLQ